MQGVAVRAWRTSIGRHWPRFAGDRRPARAPRPGIAKATATPDSSLGAIRARRGGSCLANIDRPAPAAIRWRSTASSGATAEYRQGHGLARQLARRDQCKARRFVLGGYGKDGAGRDPLAIGG